MDLNQPFNSPDGCHHCRFEPFLATFDGKVGPDVVKAGANR